MDKKTSTGPIVVYTIVLALAGAALLGGGMAVALGVRQTWLMAVVVFGVLGIPIAIKLLSGAMRQRGVAVSDQVRQNAAGIIEQWSLSGTDWSDYLATSRSEMNQDQVAKPIGIAVIVMGVAIWQLLPEYDWLHSVLYGLAVAVPVAVIVWYCYGVFIRSRMQLLESAREGKVIFTEDKVLVNDLLIELTGMKRFVSVAKIDEEKKPMTMALTVSSKAGDRETNQTYRIPVAEGKEARAYYLVNKYYEDAAELRERMERIGDLADIAD
ncbi:hypothetical protein [Reichenbachiella sp. MSK19-1]|uniref:hypothetical protein n=1 Tax=Reichenbachiella sp. MSK19-1 TaxID=1897631 RepID=UPI000E6BC95E|nr:hypothetical protein [Reichenbachiella sp. MSK19-1]RJE71456.1 hypothetical protein BGP76_04980 [Reichenbachiella sp. MSK19-1]